MADVGNWAELVGCPMETPAPLGPPGEGLDSAMVSLHTDVPEALLTAMRGFIERHPNWDQYRLIQAALAGFLLQQGLQSRDLTRCYLANLFPAQAGFRGD
jgi:hypothetical protein